MAVRCVAGGVMIFDWTVWLLTTGESDVDVVMVFMVRGDGKLIPKFFLTDWTKRFTAVLDELVRSEGEGGRNMMVRRSTEEALDEDSCRYLRKKPPY